MRANISLSVLFDDIPTLLSSHLMNQHTNLETIREGMSKCSSSMREGGNPKDVSTTLMEVKQELVSLVETIEDINNCYRQYSSVSFRQATPDEEDVMANPPETSS